MLRLYSKTNQPIPSLFLYNQNKSKVVDMIDHIESTPTGVILWLTRAEESAALYLLYFLLYIKPFVLNDNQFKSALNSLVKSLKPTAEGLSELERLIHYTSENNASVRVMGNFGYIRYHHFSRGGLFNRRYDGYNYITVLPVVDKVFIETKLFKRKKPSLADFLRNTTFLTSSENLPKSYRLKLRSIVSSFIGIRGSGKVIHTYNETIFNRYGHPDITDFMPDFYLPEKQKDLLETAFANLMSTFSKKDKPKPTSDSHTTHTTVNDEIFFV